MKIGIFGGSFDPVHNGHIKLAVFALSELNLDRIIFVPAFVSPLKEKSNLLPAALRLRFLRRVLKKYPRFYVSDYEIKKKGISYTVDTLKYFKKKFGPDALFYFLAGADTLKDIFRWKSVNEVLKLCRFVAVTRPGHRKKGTEPFFYFLRSGKRALSPFSPLRLPMDALPVSSTQIRRRLKKGRSVQDLVPSETVALLEKFYKKETGKSNRRKK